MRRELERGAALALGAWLLLDASAYVLQAAERALALSLPSVQIAPHAFAPQQPLGDWPFRAATIVGDVAFGLPFVVIAWGAATWQDDRKRARFAVACALAEFLFLWAVLDAIRPLDLPNWSLVAIAIVRDALALGILAAISWGSPGGARKLTTIAASLFAVQLAIALVLYHGFVAFPYVDVVAGSLSTSLPLLHAAACVLVALTLMRETEGKEGTRGLAAPQEA